MRIEMPDFCLVVLIGPSGSGKSHLARRLFKEDEVLSSDCFRNLVCGDPADQQATDDAFDCLYHVARKRLDRRKLTVIDATNLSRRARDKALEFARDNNCFCIALVLDLPEEECLKNNACRKEHQTPEAVVRRQHNELRRVLKGLKKENFRQVHVLGSRQEADTFELARVPLWTDRSDLHGPFDIIGDIHGCYAELCGLLRTLGYAVREEAFEAIPPEGRTAIFLGDLCDRGPASASVLRLVMSMTANGHALCVPGNHDDKLLRHLEGKDVRIAHGLERTLAELEQEDSAFRKAARDFLRGLVSHYLLDDGRLVVCHAGLPAALQGRSSRTVREFCLYGDPTGRMDEYGLPERNDWAKEYHGSAFVAYGHCPDSETRIVNNTVCLDAGCVFGGSLAALRYPEREIVSIPAQREYFPSPRPLVRKADTPPLPDAQKLLERGRLETGLGVVVIRDEERSLAALEVMGRFAVDPRWLIYLPPTMSPCETSRLPEYLEHPLEAVAYYRRRNVKKVICQEKHMGSHAVVIVCRDGETAEKRFASARAAGMVFTRTGRPFFSFAQEHLHQEFLSQMRAALSSSGFWEEYRTGWVCLDCEILPWSFKAQSLIDSQYAPYGAGGANGLAASLNALGRLAGRVGGKNGSLLSEEAAELDALRERLGARRERIERYNSVWQSYCQPVSGIADLRVAPFHILATEGKVWSDVSHDRHLESIGRHFRDLPLFRPTRNRIVSLEKEDGSAVATAFWEELLADGAEGMVIKPLEFVGRQADALIQPAIKCRGREYLRIIYGAEYLDALDALKRRSLADKRKRAIREFALGLEALERFVRGEPLHRVHECVFTILALESEPQDARL